MMRDIEFIILISLISFHISYLAFPLKNDDFNLTSTDTPKELIQKLYYSNLHILINIGSQKVNTKAYLVLTRAELMISGKDIENHKYNESESESYNCTKCNNTLFSGVFSHGIISNENFNVKNNKNETITIHNTNFILAKKSREKNPPEGIVGLHLPYYDSYPDYNLIVSLKKAKATNSYNWFLDYDNYQNFESKMIVDGFPHDLNSTKYDKEKYITTNAIEGGGGYYVIWGLTFSNIYYYNNNNTKTSISLESQRTAHIQFNYELIIAPNETGAILENIFFGEYIKKNICFKDNLGNYKETFFYCKNVKEFDIKKFKTIFFKSVDMQTIFELNYDDLFYYKDDFIYFLILFQGSSWTFGELFLKKYYLVFNQDSKTIGYYMNIEEEKSINNDDPINENKAKINLIHILLILILVSIIIVGIILYTKKDKRKNRANELDDDYVYDSKINDDSNENNKIIESN